MVKELASYGGDISKFVRPDIAKSLEEKFNN
jgi:phosphopantetheine adenylyltransferase